MIRWVVVESDPPRQLHDARSRPYIDVTQRADDILQGIGNRRSAINGEPPNFTVSLSNTGFEASRAFATSPPLGVRAAVLVRQGDATVERYAGVVDSISLTQEGATLGVKA